MSCGSDKSLKLWNPLKPLLLQTYNGHGYEVLDARGSSDSSTIVSGGMDNCVFLWDVTSGQVTRRYRAHQAQVNCVRFNDDSTVVLSGSQDGQLKAWDTRSKSREPIQIMTDSKDSITSICVSNYEIATGSLDGKVRRYDLRKGSLDVDDVKCKMKPKDVYINIHKITNCFIISAPVGNICLTKDGQCVLASSINSRLKLIDKDSGEVLAE